MPLIETRRDFTGKGFCVASIDYRFDTKNGGLTIEDCVTDCKDAAPYLAKHGVELGIDPGRVFTFGDSAGGQIADMSLERRELFTHAVREADRCGIVLTANLSSGWNACGPW